MSFSEKLELLSEPFHPDEIEWRVDRPFKSGNGAFILAYINARAVMDRFDKVLGKNNWRISYDFIEKGIKGVKGDSVNGTVASLEVWDVEKGQWILKQDGSQFSPIEAFKGGISGALKRAASVWGVGRYLYEFEDYMVKFLDEAPKNQCYVKTMLKGKPKFFVKPKLPSKFLPSKDLNYSKTDENKVFITEETYDPIDEVETPKKEELINISFQKQLRNKNSKDIKIELLRMCRLKELDFKETLSRLSQAILKTFPDLEGDDLARHTYSSFISNYA